MNWKKIGRVLVCVALVLCILVNASPVRAYASMVVAPEVVAVSIHPVVASIMQAIGISPSLTSQGWAQQRALLDSCVSYLQSLGLCDEVTINVFGLEIKGYSVFGVASSVVDAVRSWLFSSGTLSYVSQSGSGIAVSVAGSSSSDALNKSLTSLFDSSPSNLLSLFSSIGVYENVFVYSLDQKNLFGFYFDSSGILCSAAFVNPLGIANSSLFGLHVFHDLEIDYNFGIQQVTAHSDSIISHYYYPYPIFYNSSYLQSYSSFAMMDALCFDWSKVPIYDDGQASGHSIDFAMFKKESTNTVLGTTSSHYDLRNFWEGKYYIREFTWNTVEFGSYVVSPGFEIGVVAPEDEDLSVAYPEWYNNSISVIDPNTDEKLTVLPIPQVNTLQGVSGMTQTDIWNGTQAGTNTGTGSQVGTGSLAGTDTETFISSLADAIIAPVVNAIREIFVPSEDFLTAKVEALTQKFGFASAIVMTVRALQDGLIGVTTEPPVIYLDLGASRGSYDLGGEVPFLDLRWYAEYKPTVDTLISAFLWICFIWRMLLKLPGIISGMPGDFVAGFAQDMGLSNHLPSRSADLERQRVEIRQSIWKGRK